MLRADGTLDGLAAVAADQQTVGARRRPGSDKRPDQPYPAAPALRRAARPGARRAAPMTIPPAPHRLPARPESELGVRLREHAGASEQVTATAAAAARRYVLAARSEATRRAYASDWAHFTTWCGRQVDEHGQPFTALPASAQSVALYLAEHAPIHKVVTLIRRCSAISAIHQAADLPSPTTTALVRTTLAGIRRVHGIAPAPKDPLLAHQVRRLLDALPTDGDKALLAARDRAVLVIGFYAALRRSELVALDTGDVEANEHGLVVTVRRSKTDQDGAGRRIAMLHTGSPDSCPAETYTALIAAGTPTTDHSPARAHGHNAAPAPSLVDPPVIDGSVFRPVDRHGNPTRLSDRAVARIIQRAAAAAGLGHLDLAGHSPRAGFATSAAAAGKSESAIMKQTGRTSLPILPMARRYIREGSLYRDNATDGLIL